MHLGMTYNQYWYGDVRLTDVYEEKRRLDVEAKNQELWLAGLYVYDALSAALSGFGKNPRAYTNKPFEDVVPKTPEQKEREQKRKSEEDAIKLEKQLTRMFGGFTDAEQAENNGGDENG